MLMLTTSLIAQAVPEPPVNEGTNPMGGFAIMAILAVIVIGISLMPSKRTHQD